MTNFFESLRQVWVELFLFLPSGVSIVFQVLIAFLLIVTVIRVIGMILDAIPFL